jgi:WD40 repeat protein
MQEAETSRRRSSLASLGDASVDLGESHPSSAAVVRRRRRRRRLDEALASATSSTSTGEVGGGASGSADSGEPAVGAVQPEVQGEGTSTDKIVGAKTQGEGSTSESRAVAEGEATGDEEARIGSSIAASASVPEILTEGSQEPKKPDIGEVEQHHAPLLDKSESAVESSPDDEKPRAHAGMAEQAAPELPAEANKLSRSALESLRILNESRRVGHDASDDGFSSFSDTPREEEPGNDRNRAASGSKLATGLAGTWPTFLTPSRRRSRSRMSGAGSEKSKESEGEEQEDEEEGIDASPSRKVGRQPIPLLRDKGKAAARNVRNAARGMSESLHALRRSRSQATSAHHDSDSDAEEEEGEYDDPVEKALLGESSAWVGWSTWTCSGWCSRLASLRPLAAIGAAAFWCIQGWIPSGLRLPPVEEDERSLKPLPPDADDSSDDILCIHVDQVDRMEGDSRMTHPMVVIHILDKRTGQYLPLAGPARAPSGAEDSEPRAMTDGGMCCTVWRGGLGVPDMGVNVARVGPTATQQAAMKGRASGAEWDEDVLMDIPFHALYATPHVLLLFEIMDFSVKPPAVHNIAWGFLHPSTTRSGSTKLATGSKQVRLQLYAHRPLTAVEAWEARQAGIVVPKPPLSGNVPSVYLQYLKVRRVKIASSLTLSLGRRSRPLTTTVLRRPVAFFERESHHISAADLLEGRIAASGDRALAEQDGGGEDEILREVSAHVRLRLKRLRGPAERCLLPTKLLHRVRGGATGCTCAKFSNGGDCLAVATSDDPLPGQSCICLLDTDSGQMRCRLSGHKGVVYDVSWSDDDCLLLSAGADGTARVWRIGKLGPENESSSTTLASDRAGGVAGNVSHSCLGVVLQHSPPTFVYCGLFSPTTSPAVSTSNSTASLGASIFEQERDEVMPSAATVSVASTPLPILTGAFDGNIHLWNSQTGQALGVLDGGHGGHKSHVNAMTRDCRSGRVYSGDGSGVVLIWRRSGTGLLPTDYTVLRRIAHAEMKGRAITGLEMAPRRRRAQLLIASRGNVLRLFDLSTYQLVHAGFPGASLGRTMIRARFSPDGKFVVCGSEDGRLRLWEAQTGRRIRSKAATASLNVPLRDVCWHPLQHTVALIGHGPDVPILLYYSERGSAVEDPGDDATDAAGKRRGTLDENVAEAALEAQEQNREAQRRAENRERLRELRLARLRDRARAVAQGGAASIAEGGGRFAGAVTAAAVAAAADVSSVVKLPAAASRPEVAS